MKRKIVLFTILLLFSLCFINVNVEASNSFTWERSSSDNSKELWVSKGNNIGINYKLLNHNKVSIGGTLINSYNYLENIENAKKYNDFPIKSENIPFYPSEFMKIVYNGYDTEGNIYLKVYRQTTNDDDFKKIIKDVNELFEDVNESKRLDKVNLLNDIILKEEYKNYDEHIVNPSKIIKFDDALIPPFKIKTNDSNSDISIELLN